MTLLADYPKNKLNALCRYLMVHTLSERLSLYVVNEYPKSGGTWIGQMLGSALGVPFPRNRFPALRSSIMHGHYGSPWGISKPVVIWRDGRDLMVSWYHHNLFINERSDRRQIARSQKDLPFHDYADVRANLPAFIEYAFTRQPYPRFSWTDFVNRWHGRRGVVYTKYEVMHQDTARELQRVFHELTGRQLEPERAREIAATFSFARQSGRQSGEEDKNSFMRKGIVGDWQNHFSPEARALFDHYAGDAMILLGYEPDHSWVNRAVAAGKSAKDHPPQSWQHTAGDGADRPIAP